MNYTLTANNEDRHKIVKEYYIKTSLVNFIYAFIFSIFICSPILLFDVFIPYLLSAFSLTLIIAIMLTIPALKIIKSNHEMIEVDEDSFKYSFADLNKTYRSNDAGEIYEREEIEMDFHSISKIEINHFYNHLTVYGPMNYRFYSDYKNKRVRRTFRVYDERNKWAIVPIFDEIEQFARYLSNKSGAPLTHIKFPAPQLFKKYKE